MSRSQSDAGGMSSQSTHTSRPAPVRNACSWRTKSPSRREYEMKTSATAAATFRRDEGLDLLAPRPPRQARVATCEGADGGDRRPRRRGVRRAAELAPRAALGRALGGDAADTELGG